jgi:hypothetical protein
MTDGTIVTLGFIVLAGVIAVAAMKYFTVMVINN